MNYIRGTLNERFWPKVNKDGPIPPHRPDLGPCWLWTASFNNKGYGMFYPSAGEKMLAHRFSYITLIGPIPDGLELDHLCRTTACCRAEHLEPVTHVENMRRGLTATKTHCLRGHLFDIENTRRTTRGGRDCRACHRLWDHARYQVKRLARLGRPVPLG